MSNLYTYVIELRDKMSTALKKTGSNIADNTKKVNSLKRSVNSLNNSSLSKLTTSFGGLFRSISPVVLLTATVYKLKKTISESQQAYKAQGVAEQQLTAIMRNTMDARRADVQSILDLASAQQRLGVIGDEVQLAGAQELSTYLTKRSSLEKLLPVMNDMLAQQYGLNASQEQAAQIGSMLGKVMDGQVGALSRYGYKFDKTQKYILQTGTEAKRAAVLFDVVNESVGGVNQALARTPEGRLKQQANDLGDLNERLGKLVVSIKIAFSSLTDWTIRISDRILSFFERNEQGIASKAAAISSLFVKAFDKIVLAIEWARELYSSYVNAVREGNPKLLALHGIIIGLTAGWLAYRVTLLGLIGLHAIINVWRKALIAYELVVFAVKNATSLWEAANWLLNLSLIANPVGLIVAGVVALIALIAFLIIKIDGWGETWSNIITFCKTVFEGFKESLQLKWMQIQNFFMNGLETIQRGWYKLQSLWNKNAANEGLASLEAERNKRAEAILKQQQKVADIDNTLSAMKVFQLKVNNTTLSDVVKGLASKLGIAPAGIAGMGSSVAEDDDGSSSSGNAAGTATAIATGGTKTTNITISLGNLVHTMTINANNVKESAKQVRDIVLDELSRTLTMAQANG